MTKRWIVLLLASISAVAEPVTAAADTIPDYSTTLTGNWGGTRSAMHNAGYDWEIVYKLDLLGQVSRPADKAYGLDNLDIKLALDGEKIAGMAGSSALLYVLSNRGGKPSALAGHSAGVDNIETPEDANTTKLYQAWVQQNFLQDRLSVLAGLYDLNSEFYVTESASIFIQPVYGIGAELAGTGQNGPSIFPTTSFGMRVKAQAGGYYLQAAVLDGVPGDPNNPHGTHIQFNKGDGALDVLEGSVPLGASEDAPDNRLSLGVWQYTARFDDLVDVDAGGNPVKRLSHGGYAMLEKVLREPGSDQAGISGFVRAGKNDGDTTQFDMTWNAGLVFSGLLPGRDQDQFGIAYAQERNGEKWRIFSGNPVVFERSLEMTWRYVATPAVVLQPDAQYLISHGSDPALDRNWWLGIRVEISL
ncbi:MAG: carbohydrate porin [Gallionella sp.]|nr:carbohydrate porin [Gallionella sp.]